MQTYLKAILGICSVALFISTLLGWPLESIADDHLTDQVAVQLHELGVEYEKLGEAQNRAIPPDGGTETEKELSDEEWLRLGDAIESQSPGPDVEILPKLLTLAKDHPTSPYALDALVFVIRRGGPAAGDIRGKPWQSKEQAIDIVLANHMNDPRIIHVFDILDGSLPSQKTEKFLRHAIQNSPKREVRAAASLSLARYFHTFTKAHKRTRLLKGKKRLVNFERFWSLIVTPYLEKEFPYDQEQVSAEIERLLIQVIKEYADIQAIDWKTSGPSKIFFESKASGKTKTYGELAKSLMFELNSLTPGKKAPNIKGTDADGKPFQLSDYKGKVILLTFSANWCGGCVELYPLERELVSKFRNKPFVLLSVSSDESIETLQASTASGKITWRCWWDGERGPISKAWNLGGIPTIILLDHQHVIQDVMLSRFTLQEEFEKEIAQLVTKASLTKSASQ